MILLMPWIHIDDEVGVILLALDTVDISGPVNAAAPNPVTNRTVSKLLGKVLKRPAFFPAPKFAVTAMRGSEVADFVTASLRVMPRRDSTRATPSASPSSSRRLGTCSASDRPVPG
jgi:uncharacterized protein